MTITTTLMRWRKTETKVEAARAPERKQRPWVDETTAAPETARAVPVSVVTIRAVLKATQR